MAISDKELESSIILGAKMIKSKFHLPVVIHEVDIPIG